MGRVGHHQQQQQQPWEQGGSRPHPSRCSHPQGRLSPGDALRNRARKHPDLLGRVTLRHRHEIHTSAVTPGRQSTERGDVTSQMLPTASPEAQLPILLIKTSHWDRVQRLDSPHNLPHALFLVGFYPHHPSFPLSHKKKPRKKAEHKPLTKQGGF